MRSHVIAQNDTGIDTEFGFGFLLDRGERGFSRRDGVCPGLGFRRDCGGLGLAFTRVVSGELVRVHQLIGEHRAFAAAHTVEHRGLDRVRCEEAAGDRVTAGENRGESRGRTGEETGEASLPLVHILHQRGGEPYGILHVVLEGVHELRLGGIEINLSRGPLKVGEHAFRIRGSRNAGYAGLQTILALHDGSDAHGGHVADGLSQAVRRPDGPGSDDLEGLGNCHTAYRRQCEREDFSGCLFPARHEALLRTFDDTVPEVLARRSVEIEEPLRKTVVALFHVLAHDAVVTQCL